jgi:hypothetical protein
MEYASDLKTYDKQFGSSQPRTVPYKKICFGIAGLGIAIAVAIGIYVAYVAAGAGAPTIKTFGTSYMGSQNPVGIQGNTIFSISNPNRVAITISQSNLLIYYPTTNAAGDQTQVGTSVVGGITVPSGATLNDTISTVIAPTNNNALTVALGNAFLGIGTNTPQQFRVNGTITGSASVVTKLTVPVFLDCIFTMQVVSANNITVTPNCTTIPGNVKLG